VTLKTPESKVIPYMAVSAFAMFCLGLLVGVFTAAIVGIFAVVA
jgi:hypothetical protein